MSPGNKCEARGQYWLGRMHSNANGKLLNNHSSDHLAGIDNYDRLAVQLSLSKRTEKHSRALTALGATRSNGSDRGQTLSRSTLRSTAFMPHTAATIGRPRASK